MQTPGPSSLNEIRAAVLANAKHRRRIMSSMPYQKRIFIQLRSAFRA
jgi:hypothetical protein